MTAVGIRRRKGRWLNVYTNAHGPLFEPFARLEYIKNGRGNIKVFGLPGIQGNRRTGNLFLCAFFLFTVRNEYSPNNHRFVIHVIEKSIRAQRLSVVSAISSNTMNSLN